MGKTSSYETGELESTVKIVTLFSLVDAYADKEAKRAKVDIGKVTGGAYKLVDIGQSALHSLADTWVEKEGVTRSIFSDILRFAGNHHKALAPGLYVGYLKAASSRAGMELCIDNAAHNMIPHERVCAPLDGAN